MILKNFSILAILLLTTSGCALLGTKQVEIVSKPIEIDIMQPVLPRPVDLTAPQWYVVSEARIANPCVKVEQEDGSMKRPKACAKEDTENDHVCANSRGQQEHALRERGDHHDPTTS